MVLRHASLLTSLRRQEAVFDGSIVLTPVDNFPPLQTATQATRWMHGLYASDKQRTEEQLKESVIQFAGRRRFSRDVHAIQRELSRRLGAENASLRLLSGLHAHIILFMGLARPGDSVALLPEDAGGHFATPGILQRLGLNVLPLAIDYENMCVDMARTRTAILNERPNILFIDRSEGLKYEDFSALANADVPIKVFDSSQYISQILHGQYVNPFEWGFDLQVFSLHKVFPGPQKAAVVGKSDDIWQSFVAAAGSYVSSFHLENNYLTGLVLSNEHELAEYNSRLVTIAEALERGLETRTVAVVPRRAVGAPEWPGTHHIWIRCPDENVAFQSWRDLEANRIQVNYRRLPYRLGWGLRLGVSAAVANGLSLDCVGELADIISGTLEQGASMQLRHRTTAMARAMRNNSPFI